MENSRAYRIATDGRSINIFIPSYPFFFFYFQFTAAVLSLYYIRFFTPLRLMEE